MLSFIICILGLVIYLLANRPTTPPPSYRAVRVMEVGRLMFWVGLLAFLLAYGNWHPAGFTLFGR